MTKAFYSAFILIMLWSCAKIDRISPTINFSQINEQSTDTVYIGPGTLFINYEITDNELIQSNKLRLVEQTSNDSPYTYLYIEDVYSAIYNKEITIVVPDSVKEMSKFFTLTIDAFDDSGNRAVQKKTIINFK